jgi:hypothetical protein
VNSLEPLRNKLWAEFGPILTISTDFSIIQQCRRPLEKSPSRPFRVLRLSITLLHVFKIKKRPEKQHTMVEAMTNAPARRKRGRPAMTDDQQVLEVGTSRATTEQVRTNSRNSETSKAASRRAASISQQKRDHDRQSTISRTGTRVGHRRAQQVVSFLQ